MQNVFPGPMVDGRQTFVAYGKDVPEGWETRTTNDAPWRVMALNSDILYQCRPPTFSDPILPVSDDGSIVTVVGELRNRTDHEDFTWYTQDGRWLPLTHFPFKTHTLDIFPLRVKRVR